MISLIEEKRDALETLCKKYHVARLDVLGSAADGAFSTASSDLDFLVEFQRVDVMNAADQYFGLLFDLEALFNRHIDLVCATAMTNPYFIKAVNTTRELLYAA